MNKKFWSENRKVRKIPLGKHKCRQIEIGCEGEYVCLRIVPSSRNGSATQRQGKNAIAHSCHIK
jgi:hypothetical protein